VKLQMFQVDAFASEVFKGNPAAVVPLTEWLPDKILAAIGMENNLSETAFFLPCEEDDADYRLRWFTPTTEVDLCGHATLATMHTLVTHLGYERDRARFTTLSGPLAVEREGGRYTLDFPSRPPEPVTPPAGIDSALGCNPVEVHAARDLLAVFDTEETVRSLRPDLARIAALDTFAVIATAPGDASDVDFVSRFFAPQRGVPEDPVTGSAHCTLTPYWARRLGKTALRALQVSARGGELFCQLETATNRVRISGRAVTYLEGTINV
jgi:PhzF family phenazine biosynthesis protein